MSDATNYTRVPNPNYSGADFRDQYRTATISEERGISAQWAPLKRTSQWKVREFLFDPAQWPNPDACTEWVHENREAYKSVGMPLRNVACFEASFADRPSGSTPTPDELAIINRYALEPLEASDVYVREMRLTNDQWGKHHVRMSRGFQRSIISTIPGKALLLGHPEVKSVPAEPIGRFFEAREVRDPETAITWGNAKFYIVKTAGNEHARAQIDGGVWQYTSVGMELDWLQCSVCGLSIFDQDCRHYPGEKYPRETPKGGAEDLDPETVPEDPGSVYCGIIYRGQGSAIEGSIVYLPELNGTQILEAQAVLAGDYGRAKALMAKPGGMTDTTGAEPAAGPEPPGTTQPADTNATNEAGDTQMTEQIAALEAARDAANGKVDALQAKVAELEAALAQVKPAVDAATALRADVVTELDRLAGLLNRTAEMAAYRDIAGQDLAGVSAEKLIALRDEWTKALDATAPPARQSEGTARDAATGNPTAVSDATPPDHVQARRLVTL